MSASLKVEAVDVVSHAMVHNRLPIITSLQVETDLPVTVEAVINLSITAGPTLLSKECRIDLDLAPRASYSLTEVDLQLDPSVASKIQRATPATLAVRLTSGSELLAHTTKSLTVLPQGQWLTSPLELATEMLAAHVLPHAKEVEDLVTEISDILIAETGSGALMGYDAGPDHVDKVIAATLEALKRKGIRSCLESSDLPGAGRGIRTPRQILVAKLGNSLDLATLIAAIIERCNLNPVLWLLPDATVVGIWRESSSLPDVATFEVAPAINQVDLNNLVLIDPMSITLSDCSFEIAQLAAVAALKQLQTSLAEQHFPLTSICDINAARRREILPLPVLHKLASGDLVNVDYVPNIELPDVVKQRIKSANVPTDDTPPRIRQWKNSLLDLSLRNRLINFTDRNAIQLSLPANYLADFEDILHSESSLELLPSDDLDAVMMARGIEEGSQSNNQHLIEKIRHGRRIYTNISKARYHSQMQKMAYRARTLTEETGANNLYVTIGMLVWEQEERTLRSPLLLIPIELVSRGRGARYDITIDPSGISTPNYCLLEKLRINHDLRIPQFENPDEDGAGVDVAGIIRAVRTAIADAQLPFRVEESSFIAILQFAKFRLWKDLSEYWQRFIEAPLVRHLALTPEAVFVDPVTQTPTIDLDSLALRCPIEADGSQLEAIADAVAGKTFVLEGPPGTGKSQTITNLLARVLAEGKTVLFVAEKRAALDVVKRRMDAAGLGPFTLDLHSKDSRPQMVGDSLKEILNLYTQADTASFASIERYYRSAVSTLRRYKDNIHSQNPAQISFYSAFVEHISQDEQNSSLPVKENELNRCDIDEARHLVSLAVDLVAAVDPANARAWTFIPEDSVTQALPTNSDNKNTDEAIRSIMEAVAAVRQAIWSLSTLYADSNIAQDGSPLPALIMSASVNDLKDLLSLSRSTLPLTLIEEISTDRWQQEADAITAEIKWSIANRPKILQDIPNALDLPLEEALAQAEQACNSFMFGRSSKLRAAKEIIGIPNSYTFTAKALVSLLNELLDYKRHLDSLRARASRLTGLQIAQDWLPDTPSSGPTISQLPAELPRVDPSREFPENEFAPVRHQIAELRKAAAEHREAARNNDPYALWIEDLYSKGYSPIRHVGERRQRVENALEELVGALELLARVSGANFHTWPGKSGIIAKFVETDEDRTARTLANWLELNRLISDLRRTGFSAAADEIMKGSVPPDDLPLAFEVGLMRASLHERSRGELERFDSLRHEMAIQRYLDSSYAARQELPELLQAKISSRLPKLSQSDELRLGRLSRELERKRNRASVRTLMDRYFDIITMLKPCVLVSPDSLARFISPTNNRFDIVVFDEASQIRVPDAIGAIGRANSVVIVGDSKQMPPTSIAEVLAADISDTDEDVDLTQIVEDQESILSEAVLARVPQKWLSWHYRSRDESLISFSNENYYDGRLASFPAPLSASTRNRKNATLTVEDSLGIEHDVSVSLSDPRGVGLSLVRVDGKFLRSAPGHLKRTNPVEAHAIVADLINRFNACAPEIPSIGVVTFNLQQRNFIEALVRDLPDQRLAQALDSTDEEGLFIKNLENVQGDERDTILFSTAFSVNDRGVLPLNFGPLSREGGERRLNVAITRARRQVVVYSSFDPGQIRTSETASTGILHLRGFLEKAEQGSLSRLQSDQRRGLIARHRDAIAQSFREAGFFVRTGIGLSEFQIDLAVSRFESGPEIAIILDGEMWANRTTVGDRDGLPVRVLKDSLGWPAVLHLWSPAWLYEKDKVLHRISELLDEIPIHTDPEPSSHTELYAPVSSPASPIADQTASQADVSTLSSEHSEEDNEVLDKRNLTPESFADSPSTQDGDLVKIAIDSVNLDAPLSAASPASDAPSDEEPSENRIRRAFNRREPVPLGKPFVDYGHDSSPVGLESYYERSQARRTEVESTQSISRKAPNLADSNTLESMHDDADFVPYPLPKAEKSAVKGTDERREIFRPWTPRPTGYASCEVEVISYYSEQLRELLLAGIAKEGPIHGERLAKLLSESDGIKRVSKKRQQELINLIPEECRLQSEPDFFVSPEFDHENWRVYRVLDPIWVAPNARRPMEHISLLELSNALVVASEAHPNGLEMDPLFRLVMSEFGCQRLTEATARRLGAALHLAHKQGRITRSERGIVPSS